MDVQDSLVNGSITIIHRLQDGKHEYEVGHVNYRNVGGGNQLVRGEKLTKVNKMDLQDINPEGLAQSIAEGNSMLTVHRCKTEVHRDETPPAEDTLRVVSRKTMSLNFSMDMVRAGEHEEEGGDDGFEEDIRAKDVGKDVLVVSMKKTSISVLRGRGCGQSCPGSSGCTIQDLVMVSESSTVKLVSSYKQDKNCVASIEHYASHDYLSCFQPKELCLSPYPEKITIYYYNSTSIDMPFRRVPVVLNFTEVSCDSFLRCFMEERGVRLQVEKCEKQKLTQFSMSDESCMSFVFFMKSNASRMNTFESALHPGWFIKIVKIVKIVNEETKETEEINIGSVNSSEEELLFIIQEQG